MKNKKRRLKKGVKSVLEFVNCFIFIIICSIADVNNILATIFIIILLLSILLFNTYLLKKY